MSSLQYPIGHFNAPDEISRAQYTKWLDDFRRLPDDFQEAAQQIMAKGWLEQTYRPGGWTAQQLIHHLADSHLHAYQRFKLALVEDHPTITPYQEAEWAQQTDYTADILPSLRLLSALHEKTYALLSAITPAEWERTFYHPGNKRSVQLKDNIGLYAWHGRHHLAHLHIILKNESPQPS